MWLCELVHPNMAEHGEHQQPGELDGGRGGGGGGGRRWQWGEMVGVGRDGGGERDGGGREREME